VDPNRPTLTTTTPLYRPLYRPLYLSIISTARGLQNFISDLRNAKSKEDESKRVSKELANIRSKFTASGSLSSYQKKKYVWKLVYAFMLGYDVDFGHAEVVSLVGSAKYSEKQVGYVAMSLLLKAGDR
jgi:AP-2 complex subunit alpha